MRISDWSSDVCSSDLRGEIVDGQRDRRRMRLARFRARMDRRDHRIRKGCERAAMAGVDGIGVPFGDAKRHARAGPVDEDRTESFAITLAVIGKGEWKSTRLNSSH